MANEEAATTDPDPGPPCTRRQARTWERRRALLAIRPGVVRPGLPPTDLWAQRAVAAGDELFPKCSNPLTACAKCARSGAPRVKITR
jgi:hypothetical protein